jgi:hypothetical protein
MPARLRSLRSILILILAALALPGCGGSTAAPSAAASPVAGAWLANSTLAAFSGGECVGGTLAAGRRDVFMAAIKQTGTSLAATITSQGNGTSCAYAGTAGNNTLSMTVSSCQTSRVPGVVCPGGTTRDLRLVGGTLTADVNAALGTGSGTDVTTWDVLAPGNPTPVGRLDVTARFTWIFLGLPPSDYHEFTGNIFPGYEDGTISIPADPNPFCAKCGWFFP